MWSRGLAGILGSFPLAGALVGFWVAFGPGGLELRLTVATLLWLPLWWLLMALAQLLPAGWRAWAAVGLANGLAFAALWLVKLGSAMEYPA